MLSIEIKGLKVQRHKEMEKNNHKRNSNHKRAQATIPISDKLDWNARCIIRDIKEYFIMIKCQ